MFDGIPESKKDILYLDLDNLNIEKNKTQLSNILSRTW